MQHFLTPELCTLNTSSSFIRTKAYNGTQGFTIILTSVLSVNRHPFRCLRSTLRNKQEWLLWNKLAKSWQSCFQGFKWFFFCRSAKADQVIYLLWMINLESSCDQSSLVKHNHLEVFSVYIVHIVASHLRRVFANSMAVGPYNGNGVYGWTRVKTRRVNQQTKKNYTTN